MIPDRQRHRMIAVDIGNTAWKFGLFDTPAYCAANADVLKRPKSNRTQADWPYPFSLDDWHDDDPALVNLTRKLGVILRGGQDERLLWASASVNVDRTKRLRDYLARNRPNDIFREISVGDVPAVNPYDRPETLGVDRFLAATAAARFLPGQRILIADIGTAAKIDYVDSDGRFRGGAIFPGPATAAHALFERTDRLPEVGKLTGGEPPYPVTETRRAIKAGIYGSLVGAILYFYGRLKEERGGALSVIFTGRGSSGLESDIDRLLRRLWREENGDRLVWTTRDLVLTGIFLTITE